MSEPNSGYCIICGAVVDYPKYYKKCRKCRGEPEIENKSIEEPIKEDRPLTFDEIRAQKEKCLHCVWMTLASSTIVCAFPYCVNRK